MAIVKLSEVISGIVGTIDKVTYSKLGTKCVARKLVARTDVMSSAQLFQRDCFLFAGRIWNELPALMKNSFFSSCCYFDMSLYNYFLKINVPKIASDTELELCKKSGLEAPTGCSARVPEYGRILYIEFDDMDVPAGQTMQIYAIQREVFGCDGRILHWEISEFEKEVYELEGVEDGEKYYIYFVWFNSAYSSADKCSKATVCSISQNEISVPIGAIAFYGNDTPDIWWSRGGYQLCRGDEIIDPQSPLLGQYTPDVFYDSRFFRGGVTAGILQDFMIKEHNHYFASRKTYAANPSYARGYAYPLKGDSNSDQGAGPVYNTNVTGDYETRPICYTVYPFLRIK